MSDSAVPASEFCVFCAIRDGELPASFVYRDDVVMSIMDINPVVTGHFLVIPLDHLPDLADVPAETSAYMMQVAQRLAAAARASTDGIEGMNLFYADGPIAGQEVPHAHLHLLPRSADDGFGLRVARGATPSREDLDAVAQRVASAL
ncbi:MAG: HIT family protein [Actinomycetota bacterium]